MNDKKKDPKISIIIPAYNAEKTLRRCLNSICYQAYHNWEALVVDNNSRDKTADIIAEYARLEPRIIPLRQPIQGAGPARNIALNKASGEYVMFCDADDWFEPGMCKIMLDAIIENNADSVMCEVNLIRAPGIEYIDITFPKTPEGDEVSGFLDFNGEQRYLVPFINPPLWNKIFKMSVIDRYGLRFPNYRTNEDRLFTDSYFAVTDNIFMLKRSLYNYSKLDNDSLVIKHRKTLVPNFVKVMEDLYNFMHAFRIMNQKNRVIYSYYMRLMMVFIQRSLHNGDHSIRKLTKLIERLVLGMTPNDLIDGIAPSALYMSQKKMRRAFRELIKYSHKKVFNPVFAKNNIPINIDCGAMPIGSLKRTLASIVANASTDNNYDIIVFHSEDYPSAINEIKRVKHKKNISIRERYIPLVEVRSTLSNNMFGYERMIVLENGLTFSKDVAELFKDFLTENKYDNFDLPTQI